MKVCVLASGSKGNVTYVETSNHKILFDLGMNVKYIKEKLLEIEVLIDDIDTIVISHIHSDHVKALDSFIKKYKPNVYMTKGMLDELPIEDTIHKYTYLQVFDDDIYLDATKITVIKTSHDTMDSKGYIVSEGGKSVCYITDTGYLNQKFFPKLKDCTIYLFESNHDIEMLMNGPYPTWLKDRVVGPKGHLSNKDASIYLAKLVGVDTQKIVLMHLSEHNNRESVALDTIHSIFMEYGVDFNNIVCAKQNERSELFLI